MPIKKYSRKVSVSQMEATKKYVNKTYDTFTARVPKGQLEKYKAQAESEGMGFSKWVTKCLDNALE